MKTKRIFCVRFSAMGDVALLLPVLKTILEQNPNVSLTLITKKPFGSLFFNIDRLQVEEIELSHYKGFIGLYRLFSEKIAGRNYEGFADVHGSLRTRILRLFCWMNGIKVRSIDKQRKERKAMIEHSTRNWKPLAHSTEQYFKVFKALGFNCQALEPQQWFLPSQLSEKKIETTFFQNTTPKISIGIAPFAGFPLKEWPYEHTEKLIHLLLQSKNYDVYIFSGKSDRLKLKTPNEVRWVCDAQLELGDELQLLSKMSVLVCMDSGNMHLATLVQTKVLALFGSTHPLGGFAPLFQLDNVIQIDDLACRPCSVFGNQTCSRGDFACMHWISPKKVFDEIEKSTLSTTPACDSHPDSGK